MTLLKKYGKSHRNVSISSRKANKCKSEVCRGIGIPFKILKFGPGVTPAPTFNYPSIHFLYPLNPSVGSRGAGAYPSGHRARGGVQPGQVASPSQGHKETNNHTHSLLRTILESPINPTCVFLDGGRKPEYPERTHAYTVLTTTPPCSPTFN